jgi:hypothetical protein
LKAKALCIYTHITACTTLFVALHIGIGATAAREHVHHPCWMGQLESPIDMHARCEEQQLPANMNMEHAKEQHTSACT